MGSLWCKKDAECTKMVIKKVLDSDTFTALPKSLLYIPPRAVSRNGLVVSETAVGLKICGGKQL